MNQPPEPDLRASRPARGRIDRLPPHSPEAERGALSCVLQDADRGLAALVAHHIGVDSFYDLRHQAIYNAILDLSSMGRPIDEVTMSSHLMAGHQFEAVGGSIYLMEVMDAAPSPANLPTYVEILREKEGLRRALQACTDAICDIYDNESEPAAVLDRMDRAISEVRPEHGHSSRSMKDLVGIVVDRMEQQFEGLTLGLATGLADLDKELDTQGLRDKDFIVIAARPQCGKTAFAVQLATKTAQELQTTWEVMNGESEYAGPIVLFFSIEMSAEAITRRMIGHLAQTNMRVMKDLSERDIARLTDAAGRIASFPIVIDDTPAQTTESIRARAMVLRRRRPIKLLIVDYLQLIAPSEGRRQTNRQEEMAGVSRRMKALSKELGCPVVCLAQLNREAEKESKRTPRMSDLRESGQIEQDADLILFLHPRKSGDEDATYTVGPSPAWVTIGKQRDGPSGISVPVEFNKPLQTFAGQARVSYEDTPKWMQ